MDCGVLNKLLVGHTQHRESVASNAPNQTIKTPHSHIPHHPATHRVVGAADVLPADEDVGHGAAARHVGQHALEVVPVLALVLVLIGRLMCVGSSPSSTPQGKRRRRRQMDTYTYTRGAAYMTDQLDDVALGAEVAEGRLGALAVGAVLLLGGEGSE